MDTLEVRAATRAQALESQQIPTETLHRVIAHHMDDDQKATAESGLSVHESLPAFVIGLGTPAQINDLRAQALIVEDLGPTVDKSKLPHPADSIPSYPAQIRVKIWGPITSARRSQLRGDLVERVSSGDYLFRVNEAQEVRALWSLGFVDKITPYSGW